jgi:mannitol/fructose-specific phosphotransferase system IIA component (Ntr-type)
VPLASLLGEARIIINLRAQNKSEAIRAMADRLVSSGGLRAEARETVIEALEAREKVSSTALDHGIAIPHATVDSVTRIEAVLGVLPAAIPFDAPDGRTVNLIILLLIPRSAVRKYSSTLAGIARLLAKEETREALHRAETPEKALQALRAREQLDTKEEIQ